MPEPSLSTHAQPTIWRVLIVEDDHDMREFFKASVLKNDALRLLACVSTVEEALQWLRNTTDTVDALLIDIGLPDGSGVDVIRFARTHHPGCEPLVVSVFGDEDHVLACIEAGAVGYVHKDATPEDVAQTIINMKRGGSTISPMIARKILDSYCQTKPAPGKSPATARANADTPAQRAEADAPILTDAEKSTLDLLARGFSYQEIARIQDIRIHNVQAIIKKLYNKLAVHSKTEAVYEAGRLRILPLQT